jgi:hypothetical protein
LRSSRGIFQGGKEAGNTGETFTDYIFQTNSVGSVEGVSPLVKKAVEEFIQHAEAKE